MTQFSLTENALNEHNKYMKYHKSPSMKLLPPGPPMFIGNTRSGFARNLRGGPSGPSGPPTGPHGNGFIHSPHRNAGNYPIRTRHDINNIKNIGNNNIKNGFYNTNNNKNGYFSNPIIQSKYKQKYNNIKLKKTKACITHDFYMDDNSSDLDSLGTGQFVKHPKLVSMEYTPSQLMIWLCGTVKDNNKILNNSKHRSNYPQKPYHTRHIYHAQPHPYQHQKLIQQQRYQQMLYHKNNKPINNTYNNNSNNMITNNNDNSNNGSANTSHNSNNDNKNKSNDNNSGKGSNNNDKKTNNDTKNSDKKNIITTNYNPNNVKRNHHQYVVTPVNTNEHHFTKSPMHNAIPIQIQVPAKYNNLRK